MEYIYIIGIIGYYLYKAYSSKKEKEEQENIPKANTTKRAATSSKEKKKGFLEQMLEDMAQEYDATPSNPPQQYNAPVDDFFPPPVHSSQRTAPSDEFYPPSRRPVSKPKPKAKEPIRVVKKELLEMTTSSITGLAVAEGEIGSMEEEEARKKKQSDRNFAGMNLSAREAIKSQIILERKF